MTPLARGLAGAALLLGVAASATLAQQTRQLVPVAAPPATSSPAAGTPAPPDTPFLRVDADFHTLVVNRFAQDRNGRIIATASDDKTIRIWQASDGALLSTLRVPVANGEEGALYAVAISPDGKTLIAGGSTGFTWDKSFCVYLFDLDTLRMKGRLPNLPGPIDDLAFSPDGSSFAVGMGGGAGVWLMDARNGSTIGSDGQWTGTVTSVKFDPRGRVLATGFGGEVRLYDPTLRRVAARTPVRGGHPYSLAVSPDGRYVAVGYSDQPRVEVLNLQDLSPRSTLDTDPNGRRITGDVGFGAVGWTADGSVIAAGNVAGPDGRNVIRRWPAGGGRPMDAQGLKDMAFQIAGTPDGGAILVGADPALQRVDRAGRTVFRRESPGLDFRDMGDRLFRVSDDGTSVQLETKTMREPWTVDLGQRRIGPPTTTRGLTPVAAPPAAPPPPMGPRPDVVNWRNSAAPRINGRPAALDPDETSHAYAIAPSNQFVVLGTDYRLRVYRADGAPLGVAELPGTAWAVGVSGDSRVVVAAVGDGTLRWFGLDAQGQLTPRVALFAAADTRWVAWSAAGFFDYSDNGASEGMVGVLLNHARGQAPDWFSFAQVYRRYYAPETVAAALRGQTQFASSGGAGGSTTTSRPGGNTGGIGGGTGGGGITEVRQTITQSPPPTIDLAAICWNPGTGRTCKPLAASNVTRSLTVVAANATGPASGGVASVDASVPESVGRIILQYRLRGADGTSSKVDLFVNGHNDGRVTRPVSTAGDTVFEQPITIDSGDNKLQLRAYDNKGETYAQSRELQVTRATPPQAKVGKPTLFMLSAGVDKYGPKIQSLSYSVADARAVAAAVKSNLPDSYDHIELIELYNDKASKEAVVKAFADIGSRATPQDTVLIYLSGHGHTIDDHYFYITQNVPSAQPKDIKDDAVGEETLVTGLAGIRANNTMLFLDTCHAGAFSLTATSNFAHETGRYVLAGATSVEEALDSYDSKNGVFATAVLRGLAGRAANGAKLVDNFQLGFFVQPLVRQLAKEVAPDHNQSAQFKIEAENAVPFPIAAVKTP